MCLIAFAWNVHPRWPLLLCANRDEFHARPTAALAPWDGHEEIVGGRDLLEGGGWLAIHRSGRFAAVTNVREPQPPAAPRSRGSLVRDFLTQDADLTLAEHAETLRDDAASYGPFNLLMSNGRSLVHVTNRPEPRWKFVAPGIHTLSNGTLDSPWPKAQRLGEALEQWMHTHAAELDAGIAPDTAALFTALASRERAADADLPDTGVGIERERLLCTAFIEGEHYGTRASTVLLLSEAGTAHFSERSFGPSGAPGACHDLEIPVLFTMGKPMPLR